MKKTSKPRLTLSRETLRILDLSRVHGGRYQTHPIQPTNIGGSCVTSDGGGCETETK